jgi:hypothetical protein
MQSDRRFLLPLCAAVTEGDKTGDIIRLSQDGYGSLPAMHRLSVRNAAADRSYQSSGLSAKRG